MRRPNLLQTKTIILMAFALLLIQTSSAQSCTYGSECGENSWQCDGSCGIYRYERICTYGGECTNGNITAENCGAGTICSGGSCVGGDCDTVTGQCDGDCHGYGIALTCNGAGACSQSDGYWFEEYCSSSVCIGYGECSNELNCGHSTWECQSDSCTLTRYELLCDGADSCTSYGDQENEHCEMSACTPGASSCGQSYCSDSVSYSYSCLSGGCGSSINRQGWRKTCHFVGDNGGCNLDSVYGDPEPSGACSDYELCSGGSCHDTSSIPTNVTTFVDPAVTNASQMECHNVTLTNACGYNNIDYALMRVNWGNDDNHTNPNRGYFGWYASEGYTTDPAIRGGAANYGNPHIILNESSSTVTHGSASGGIGSVIMTACYTLNQSYGAYSDNDVSLLWSDCYDTPTSCEDDVYGWYWLTSEDQRFDTLQCGSDADCGVCKQCTDSSCVNQAFGDDLKDECGAIFCNGTDASTQYYWGWSGKTCYYRNNISAADVNCAYGGVCNTSAIMCPLQDQGTTTGVTCTSEEAQIGCTGTTAGSCDESLSVPWGYHMIPDLNNKTGSRIVFFKVNASDTTSLKNVTLYIWNSSSNIIYTNSKNISGLYNETNWTYTFTVNGTYNWSAKIYDTDGYSNWTDQTNWTLVIDVDPQIDIELVFPTLTQVNVSRHNWFQVQVNVTCLWADCGQVNVSLDPAGDQSWNKSFGTSSIDQFRSVAYTSDGGYVMCGQTANDIYIVKTDSAGIHQWNKTYSPLENSAVGYDIIQTSDGGYAIVGVTQYDYGAEYGNLDNAAWLIKIDSSGDPSWNMTYPSSVYGGVNAYSLVQASDGGYAIAGARSDNGEMHKFWVLKTDESGNEVYSRTWGGDYTTDRAYSIYKTNDNTYIVGGSRGSGAGTGFFFIRLNSTIESQWSQNYYSGEIHSIIEADDGGFVATGTCNGFDCLVKSDSDGTQLWNKTYGGAGGDEILSTLEVIQALDGGYAVVGTSNNTPSGNYSFWLLKTDSAGGHEWNKTFGGDRPDTGRAIDITSDGEYILAGDTLSIGSGSSNYEAWIVKVLGSGLDKGGLISIIAGATPFYTNESNPKTYTLNAGQSQFVTFWVNATGAVGNTYEFFAEANQTVAMTTLGNQTRRWNVTIVSNLNDNGDQCTEDNECTSGNCVDGVCCNTVCSGTCQRCDLAATNGTCTNTADGQDYDDECPGAFGTCADTTCNGAGACNYVAAGEGGCATCTRCSGSAFDCANIADNTQDEEGSNICSATCVTCNGAGSCVNQDADEDLFTQCDIVQCDDGATPSYYYGWDTLTCYYALDVPADDTKCDGSGACKVAADYCGSQGQDGSSGVICNCTAAQTGCTSTTVGTCDDSKCYPWGYHVSPADTASVTTPVLFMINESDETNLKNVTLHIYDSSESLIHTNFTDVSGVYNTTNWTYNFATSGTYYWTAEIFDTEGHSNLTDGGNWTVIVKFENGTQCSSNDDCFYSQCVDSVCCNTACSGTCERCDLAATNGTCTSSENGQDYDAECPGVFGTCAGTTCNGAGACNYVAAGEGDCAACTRCSGSAFDCVNIADNTQDEEGSNICSATCVTCNGAGSCVNQDADEDLFTQCDIVQCDDGATPSYYYGWATLTCYYRVDVTADDAKCDGAGACKAAADYCGSQGQGDATGTTCSCEAAQTDCSGTTEGSCDNGVCAAATVHHLLPLNDSTSTSYTVFFKVNESHSTGLSNVTLYIWNSTAEIIHTNLTNISGVYNETNWTYTFTYTGVFNWSAKAFDENGNSAWADSTNWTLTILENLQYGYHVLPLDGANMSMTVTFFVNESDDTNLENVTLFIWNSTANIIHTNSTNVSGTYNETNWTYTFPYIGVFNWSAQIFDAAGYSNWTDETNWTIIIRYVNGTQCTYGSECEAFQCVDGVCCNTACSGTCQRCDLTATNGTCTNTPSDQDYDNECGAVDCDDGATPSYYYGWDTLTCYYRLDVAAENANCDGAGACKVAADYCGSQGQDGSTGTSCSCEAAQIGCSGTTEGSCNDGVCSSAVIHHMVPVNGANSTSLTVFFKVNESHTNGLSNVTLYIWNSSAELMHTNFTEVSGVYNETNWTYTFAYTGVFNWSAKAFDENGNSAWADSTNWTLIVKYENGTQCADGTQCMYGNCVDGVCCNTVCSGTCQRCDLAATNGTCTNTADGQDYDDECPGAFGTCADTTCNGAGACNYVAAGEGDCATCTRCSGSAFDCANIADNTQDEEGSNTCSATCVTCNGAGSCVNQDADEDLFTQCDIVQCDDGATPSYYYGWATLTCYYALDVTADDTKCDGSGACKVAADYCGSQGQDGSTGTSCSCEAAQTGCSGTTVGSCNNGVCSGPTAHHVTPSKNANAISRTVYFEVNESHSTGLANVTLYIWDSDSNIIHTNVTLVYGVYNETNWTYTFSSDGIYNWSAKVFDENGNSAWADSTNWSLKVDSTPPGVASLTHSPSANGLGMIFNITATISDALSSVDEVLVGLTTEGDETNYTMFNTGSSYYRNFTIWTNGTRTYRIYSVDSLGNRNDSESGNVDIYVNSITIQIRTLKETYSLTEIGNLTDPPMVGEPISNIDHKIQEISEIVPQPEIMLSQTMSLIFMPSELSGYLPHSEIKEHSVSPSRKTEKHMWGVMP